jgi:hypothetical protein
MKMLVLVFYPPPKKKKKKKKFGSKVGKEAQHGEM